MPKDTKKKLAEARARVEALKNKKIGRRKAGNLFREDRQSAKSVESKAKRAEIGKIKMTPGKGSGAPKMKYSKKPSVYSKRQKKI